MYVRAHRRVCDGIVHSERKHQEVHESKNLECRFFPKWMSLRLNRKFLYFLQKAVNCYLLATRQKSSDMCPTYMFVVWSNDVSTYYRPIWSWDSCHNSSIFVSQMRTHPTIPSGDVLDGIPCQQKGKTGKFLLACSSCGGDTEIGEGVLSWGAPSTKHVCVIAILYFTWWMLLLWRHQAVHSAAPRCWAHFAKCKKKRCRERILVCLRL